MSTAMDVIPTDKTVLATVPKTTALSFFVQKEGVDPLLARIRSEIDAFQADVTTAKGRKAVASMAYTVARTKTAIDAVGKELVAEQKDIPNRIDATRRHLRDTLDKWQEEVRAPLTAWEKDEEDRVSRIKSNMAAIQTIIDDREQHSSATIRNQLGEVKSAPPSDERFGEYVSAAADLWSKTIAVLEARLDAAGKREAEVAELDRLRAEAAAREQADRDARIATEAAERARAAAEAKAAAETKAAEDAARREREAAERRELELKLQAEQAERRAAEAEARATQAAEAKLAEEAKATAAREADAKHRAATNSAAKGALVEAGIDDSIAKLVVTLIASGKVPHVVIRY